MRFATIPTTLRGRGGIPFYGCDLDLRGAGSTHWQTAAQSWHGGALAGRARRQKPYAGGLCRALGLSGPAPERRRIAHRGQPGRLLNRRYKVAQVERGTRATLMEELCAAFAATFGGTEVEWKDDPRRMLALAASMSDGPLVLIIDTALGREDRVRRDDGPLLSELAEAAAQSTAFVALALDDDIEGADGANVALSGAFQIDYLDPEHLYGSETSSFSARHRARVLRC